MNYKLVFTICIGLISFYNTNAQNSIEIGRLKYNGGGDWYANPTSLPNLINFCNKQLGTTINPEEKAISATDNELFNLPFIHMTGHGNVIFSDEEAENLRLYLLSGGFLHIDDNYGMDPYIQLELKKIFPNRELVEVPINHPIFHQKFVFKNGLPKIHEHDGKAPKAYAIMDEGRILVFYTVECDLGDGWEDASVHQDPEEIRMLALQMGANILEYVFMRN